MRILYMGLGDTVIARHLPQSWPDRLFRGAVGQHEVITFGYAADLDIQVRPDAAFADVLARLPAGWVPDVCVCVHVDYLIVPPGIEEAPFPTVAVTADWDFRIGIASTVAEAFDLTVALGDESCAAMRLLGARETLPFAYFGVPEELLQGPLEDIDRHRPIDVLFTGTIHDDTHRDRSRWLARLARLSDRHAIHIGEASSAQDSYRELLKRSKLVFTFHRRGELQLRFTDAVTQGALVLDEGVQTRAHFDAGSEFLCYDANNLEALIERHLADPALRRRKVAAARARVAAEFGSVHRLARLFDSIEQRLRSTTFGARPAQLRPAGELARRAAEQHYANHFDCSMGPSDHYLGHALAAAEVSTPGPRRDNDLAVIRYALARHGAGGDARGRAAAAAAFSALNLAHPRYAMGWFNTGYALWSEDRHDEASACFARAYDLLTSGGEFDPWALYDHEQHREPHGFKKAWNDALFALVRTGDDQAARRLVAACCAFFLARDQERRGHLFEAYDLFGVAAETDPGRAEFARRAALAADVLGFTGEALHHFEQATGLLPLDVDWRLSYIDFLTRAGLLARSKQMLYEAVALLRATKGDAGMRERVRCLAAAMSHAHCRTPVLRELLHDRFATTALAQLCERLSASGDPRIEARVADLLAAQGKVAAAAEWAAQCRPEAELSPGNRQLLSDYRARLGRQAALLDPAHREPAGTVP